MKIHKLYYFIILILALVLSEQVWAKDKIINKSETDNAQIELVQESKSDELFTLNTELLSDGTAKSESPDIEKKKDKKNKKDVIKIDSKFFINFGINLATILLIIFLIYYPENKNKSTIFSLILFNVVIFLLTFVLNDIKISMGAAFGLFAVFSMLRYRTAGMSLKDMTYLFIFIALGLVGAIGLKVQDLAIINGIIFIFIFVLDGGFIFKREYSQIVVYEKIENIKVENYDILLEDLKERTGLNIHRIAIGKLNYLRDSAQIKVFYYQKNKKVYPYCEEK
ncbi:MAG TPA: DUF4956 domain-containing protein [Bacteroidales bacterium]|nr:DUF4956 domain-containing protein [Bacteroidales bacterium]HOR60568.1 DUF4956 domain-containing protein [Bacteroidales bacterium]HPL05287.1 DUF4956 domain-containing protein [Bacteroidales bacterium]